LQYYWQENSNPKVKKNIRGDFKNMPITDPEKKRIAQAARLHMKICLNCGGRNSMAASRCRKCRGSFLRLKNRTLGAKK
jgi:large subunit ribosomal protein L40e